MSTTMQVFCKILKQSKNGTEQISVIWSSGLHVFFDGFDIPHHLHIIIKPTDLVEQCWPVHLCFLDVAGYYSHQKHQS